MNIFFLDDCPGKAARAQADKHVLKMPVECTQMLVAALRRHGAGDADVPLTKSGHPHRGGYPNHPSTRWVGDSSANFFWLADHGLALCREYTYRYGRVHACEQQIYEAREAGWDFVPYGPMTEVPLCIGEDLQAVYGRRASLWDAPEAYQHFYRVDKRRFARWDKGRDAPFWW
jgi:hypothetical protein